MTRGIARKKLVVVGDGGCGKTSLLVVYQKKAFPQRYVPTVFENYIANVPLESGKIVELALWDTAGQEDYDRLRPLSYPETDVVLICFAINLRTSFTNVLDRWLPEVTHFCENIPKLLVGTKLDFRQNQDEIRRLGLVGQRLITVEEGEQLAKEIGAKYYECSAMKKINVDEVIEAATRAAVAGSMRKLHKRLCKIL
ncbi:MAG: signal transducer [Benjaminiella poitrasii]|nr:MAG: signal transducer [Benjaminiella poitrasii]